MSRQRWTAEDIPAQQGRVAVVTGANTGLGLETAKVLAARGATVVLAVRDAAKGAAAARAVSAAATGAEVTVQSLDLSSLDSVRAAAAELLDRWERIDLLINNAGVMWTPKGTTADGFELQFGTNHLGHFALTGLLVDRLRETEGSRIVTVSSVGHRLRADIHFDDLQWERRYDRIAAYGQSKLANLLFTYELQRRLAAAGGPTVALAAHPGGSNTELVRNSPAPVRVANRIFSPLYSQSAAQGALPTLRAATDRAAEGGTYYGPDGFQELRGHPVVVASSDRSHDRDVQRRLWAVSEELTGVSFPV
jgi:NAD(P)-dependent dehydrogenase (short-subunit alcohol dehydrogenase family)